MFKRFLFICIAVLILFSCVQGLEYQGEIGQSTGWYSQNWNTTSDGGGIGSTSYFIFNDIENTGGAVSYIHFDYTGTPASYASGAANANMVPMILTVNGGSNDTIATGYVGYQRNFDSAWPIPNEIAGYQYLLFDNWNLTGKTGDIWATINFNSTALGWSGLYPHHGTIGTAPPLSGVGGLAFWNSGGGGASQVRGWHTFNRNVIFSNYYYVALNEINGMIEGWLQKQGSGGGTTYNSRAMIFNGDTNQLITSEGTTTSATFNITVFSQNIKIGARDSTGIIWNSSVLSFPAGGVTFTPTPTPSGTAAPTVSPYPTVINPQIAPVVIPPGHARTWIKATDANTGGLIPGVTINIYDVGNSTWHNLTTQTGISWIDTAPNDVINYEIRDTSGLYYDFIAAGRPTPFYALGEMTYTEILYPTYETTPVGSVKYWVQAIDWDAQEIINGATIKVQYGSIINTSITSGAGETSFIVPNNTLLTITSSKTGYITLTRTINSGPLDHNGTSMFMFAVSSTNVPHTTAPTTTGTGAVHTTVTFHTATPTITISPSGTGTGVPVTTTPPNYTGFWSPILNALTAMGASAGTLGLLLAGILIFIGFVIGGWSAAPYGTNTPFNTQASLVGGILGFIASCAFGFIPLVYVIAVIFIGVFAFIFLRNG